MKALTSVNSDSLKVHFTVRSWLPCLSTGVRLGVTLF